MYNAIKVRSLSKHVSRKDTQKSSLIPIIHLVFKHWNNYSLGYCVLEVTNSRPNVWHAGLKAQRNSSRRYRTSRIVCTFRWNIFSYELLDTDSRITFPTKLICSIRNRWWYLLGPNWPQSLLKIYVYVCRCVCVFIIYYSRKLTLYFKPPWVSSFWSLFSALKIERNIKCNIQL